MGLLHGEEGRFAPRRVRDECQDDKVMGLSACGVFSSLPSRHQGVKPSILSLSRLLDSLRRHRVRYGIILTAGDIHEIVAMAAEAEEAGWDGVFYWDGVA